MALKIIDKQTLKLGLKMAIPTGAGIVLAKAGGLGLRRAFSAAEEFAASDTGDGWKAGLVDAVGGGLLGGAGLFAMSKISTPQKAQDAAPFVMGGVLLGAFAVPLGTMVTDRVVGFIDGLFDSEPSNAVVEAAEAQAAAALTKGGGQVIDMPQYRGLLGNGAMSRGGGAIGTKAISGTFPHMRRGGGAVATKAISGTFPRAGGAVYRQGGPAGMVPRARRVG